MSSWFRTTDRVTPAIIDATATDTRANTGGTATSNSVVITGRQDTTVMIVAIAATIAMRVS